MCVCVCVCVTLLVVTKSLCGYMSKQVQYMKPGAQSIFHELNI